MRQSRNEPATEDIKALRRQRDQWEDAAKAEATWVDEAREVATRARRRLFKIRSIVLGIHAMSPLDKNKAKIINELSGCINLLTKTDKE